MTDYNANITLNLPVPEITAGEGAVDETLADYGVGNDFQILALIDATEDGGTALASETLLSILPGYYENSAVGDSSYDFTISLEETSTADTEGAPATTSQTTTLVSSAKAIDIILRSTTATLENTVLADDAHWVEILYTLESTGIANSEFISGNISYYELSSSALASDSMQLGFGYTFEFSAVASDSMTTQNFVSELLVSTGLADSLLVNEALISNLLISTAVGSDSMDAGGSVYTYTLGCTARASNRLFFESFESLAWVMNTESAGLSKYDNYDFNSMALHEGVLYATSPVGVFQLTGDKDSGRQINALYETGFDDFNSEQKKRLIDLFVGYAADGILECSVETYDGPSEVFSYSMPMREADSPRNNRINPGRGLVSRYWRFTIKNVDGADFQIYDLTVNIARSTRRI